MLFFSVEENLATQNQHQENILLTSAALHLFLGTSFANYTCDHPQVVLLWSRRVNKKERYKETQL